MQSTKEILIALKHFMFTNEDADYNTKTAYQVWTAIENKIKEIEKRL